MASVVLTGYLYKTDGTAISGATVDVYTHADPPVTLLATTTTSAAGKWTATLTGADAVSGKTYDVKFTVAGGQYFYIKGSSDYEVGRLHVVSDVYIDTNGHGLYFMDSGNNQVRLIRLHTDDHLRIRAIEDKTIVFEDDAGVSMVTIDEATSNLTVVGKIIGPTIGPNGTQQHTLPAVASDTVALIAATQTFTNKTHTNPTLNGTITAAAATDLVLKTASGQKFFLKDSAGSGVIVFEEANDVVIITGTSSTAQSLSVRPFDDLNATQQLFVVTDAAGTAIKFSVLKNGATAVAGTLAVTGVLTASGRITATAVGGSAKTLLNFVPVDPGTSYTTTKTGSGNGSGYLTLTGLPSTAVAASLHLKSSSSALVFHVYQDNSGLVGPLTLKPAADGNTVATADMKVTAGGSNQVYYDATGSGSWSFDVNILGYWEPA